MPPFLHIQPAQMVVSYLQQGMMTAPFQGSVNKQLQCLSIWCVCVCSPARVGKDVIECDGLQYERCRLQIK